MVKAIELAADARLGEAERGPSPDCSTFVFLPSTVANVIETIFKSL